MSQLKIRPVFFGLMYKVVLFTDNYDRQTLSYHFTQKSAAIWLNDYKRFY